MATNAPITPATELANFIAPPPFQPGLASPSSDANLLPPGTPSLPTISSDSTISTSIKGFGEKTNHTVTMTALIWFAVTGIREGFNIRQNGTMLAFAVVSLICCYIVTLGKTYGRLSKSVRFVFRIFGYCCYFVAAFFLYIQKKH